MKMTYRVSLWASGVADKSKHYMSRAQAYYGLRLLAYDRLDTVAAHNVMAIIDCHECERDDQIAIDVTGTPYTLYLEKR
jgi:hypothetical protein